jgi:hypothetical protein
MFTNNDYKEYFEQIARVERAMIYDLQDLVLIMKDGKNKKILENITDDEVRHYSYILKIFNSFLFENVSEKRQHVRTHSLGRVVLENIKNKDIIKGHCVDISDGGVRIETDKKIDVNDKFNLEIGLYNNSDKIKCLGRLVWVKEIENEGCIGGIEFIKK